MKNIDWKLFDRNNEPSDVLFEQFCFQIAYKKYGPLGHFDSWYNTPGSDFYLTLDKDAPHLQLKAGEVIGWQAKFWLNNRDESNSPLNRTYRDELEHGFYTSLQYKPALKKWIICTPGKFINSSPHKCLFELEVALHKMKPDMQVEYWHKDIFLAFALEDVDFFNILFSHYFAETHT
jgi:hypothetical protein